MKPASFTSYEGAELDTMLPCASRQHMCLLRSDGRLKMTHAPLYPGGCAGCPVADGRSCAAELPRQPKKARNVSAAAAC